MELVYLWVEDYKNIQKQGFNFSPRFTCDYNDEINELTIDENDDYIENFFGDNINVTAIVGKNGSGKSNLLELLFYSFFEGVFSKKETFFLVYYSFKRNKLFFGTKGIDNLTINNVTHIPDLYDSLIFHDSIYFDNFYKRLNINHPIKRTTSSGNQRHDASLSSELKKTSGNFANQVAHYYANNIKRSIILLKTTSIKLPNDFSKIKSIKLKFTNDVHFPPKTSYLEKYKKVFVSLFNKNLNNKNSQKKTYDDLLGSKDRMIETSKNFVENIEQFLKLLPEPKEEYNFEEFSPEFIDAYLHIVVMTKEFLHFEWQPSLSSGEETLLFQFANFYNVIKEKKILSEVENNKSYTIYIDEGENTLHPNWQKRYVSYIVQFFKDNFPKNEIHIILTSHSPFLLSDIPKQNIIFLDKDEKGNCKVVNGLKEKKQTFGANIHTLLSDSFFMEDGLMGEFAKAKIDKAIKLLNQDTLDEKELKYCEQIISIIGEPIVKNQLQRMLTDKKISYLAKDTREEIEFLKHRIDLLSKRL